MREEIKERIEKIQTPDELNAQLDANATEAELLKEKSVAMAVENTQEFINWQDRLNAVSLQPDERC
jgi:hypothetical protein